MNAIDRIKMVKAMEFLTRCINDESIFESWLTYGVADGDIRGGDLGVNQEDTEDLDYYIEDESFAGLMSTFLQCMADAFLSGGLYFDDVVSSGATTLEDIEDYDDGYEPQYGDEDVDPDED